LLLTRSEPAIATLRLSAPALFFAGASVVAANAWMGLYGSAALGTVERFRRRIFAGLLMPWLAVAVIAWDRPLNMMIVGLFILVAAMLVPLGMICEAALRRIWPFVCRGNTLLVGSAAFGDQFAALLEARPELGLRPIGIVNDAPDATSSLRWLGRVSDLRSLAADVDVVAVLPPLDLLTVTRLRLPVGRIVVLSDADADAVTTSSLAGRHIGAATVFELHNPSLEGVARQVKRFLELCIAIPALILSAPLIGLVAIVIKITSPGPALYAQYRVGLRGEPVPVHKLRSMYPDAERRLEQLLADDAAALSEWNRYMKLKRDPRILPYIGAFIRKTSIDELPQLWDVVRGTMALVGPRPFPDYHVTKFSPEFQSLRASVKPGLTGLWQVSDRSDADLRQQEILDTFYIRNWSLWLDAYIVARTFSAVLFSQGAR
jgi:exopolysaccharide biosynthesis polyprenyl glycosylphosphotransferase